MSKFIFLVIISSLFISCDPALRNHYVIANESDYDCEVSFKLNEGFRNIYQTDSIQIIEVQSMTTIEITNYTEIGNSLDKKQSFLEAFEVLELKINEEVIDYQFRDRKNWQNKIIKNEFMSNEVEYKVTIKNEFVKKGRINPFLLPCVFISKQNNGSKNRNLL